MGIISAIGNLFRLAAEAIGLVNKRTDLKNAPDVRAAAIEKSQVSQQDRVEQHIAARDLDETRKDLAE